MDKRKDGVSQTTAAVYREKIVEMVKRIEDEKFLKRIYLSLRDYISDK